MKTKTKIYGTAVLIVAAIIGGTYLYRQMTVDYLHDVKFTKNGERVCGSGKLEKECKYLEYTENETFENTDDWAFLKFNSSDVHRIISAGTTCETVEVQGFRLPFMSWYRNILKVDGCK